MPRPKKQPPAKKPVPASRNIIEIQGGKTPAETLKNLAQIPIDPNICAYRIIAAGEGKSGLGKDADVQSLILLLADQSKAVKAGDLGQNETMLI